MVIVLVPLVELVGVATLAALAAWVIVWMRPWNVNQAWWNLPARLVASGVNHLEHALVDSIQHWIVPPLERFAHWLAGVAAVMAGSSASALRAALGIEDALVHVANVKLPHLVNLARRDLGVLIAAAQAAADGALDWARHHYGLLLESLDALTLHVAQDIVPPLHFLLNDAIPALRRGVNAVTAEVETDVLPRLGTLGGEVASIDDLLERWGRRLDDADFWTWVASAGGLLALVRLIEAEAGLGRAECRDKVGRLCTTDPAAWANFLAGLAAIGLAFSLEDVIRVGIEGVGQAEPLIEQLH